jgi:WD40 repeat protein
VAFSPDGKRIATGSEDRTARVWDVQTGKLAATFQGHTDRVESVAFSPDGQRLLTASYDDTARVWDVQTGQELLALKGTGVVTDVSARLPVAYSPDGRYVLTGRSKDNAARVWDLQKGLK